ncbi:hypothetical protein [Telluribacter sp.]|jgi:hypothetical protein|uniref:hypothetical protein n=1 Tax=Telluribacter sp. TaxID=1978767 RepID=UPI002E0EFAC9|nr:hypothetical protein [Telluribacter sp.]
MSQVLHQTLPEDQISPKDVVFKLIIIKNTLARNWKILVLFIILGTGIGYFLDIYLQKEANYEAMILFNLGAGGAPAGGMGDLAGMLGLGGSPDANIFTGENFFYFVKSRPVVERALMKEVQVGKKKMLLANFFIDSSGIRKYDWAEIPKLKKFYFTSNDPEKYNLDQRIALNAVVEKAKVAATVFQPDRKSSFIMLQVNSINPELTKTWIETLLETVEEVYTEEQTRKTRKALRQFQTRADSLSRLLGSTESRLAREMDYSTQIVVPEGRAQVTRLSRNSQFLQQMYFEALRNVENLRASLIREAPLFTIIEPVKVPVDSRAETGKRAQLGFLIGLVLGLLTIYIKSVYTTIMADTRS